MIKKHIFYNSFKFLLVLHYTDYRNHWIAIIYGGKAHGTSQHHTLYVKKKKKN